MEKIKLANHLQVMASSNTFTVQRDRPILEQEPRKEPT